MSGWLGLNNTKATIIKKCSSVSYFGQKCQNKFCHSDIYLNCIHKAGRNTHYTNLVTPCLYLVQFLSCTTCTTLVTLLARLHGLPALYVPDCRVPVQYLVVPCLYLVQSSHFYRLHHFDYIACSSAWFACLAYRDRAKRQREQNFSFKVIGV